MRQNQSAETDTFSETRAFPFTALMTPPLLLLGVVILSVALPQLLPGPNRAIDVIGLFAVFAVVASCFLAVVFVPNARRTAMTKPEFADSRHVAAVWFSALGTPFLTVALIWLHLDAFSR
jgi:hypothetical protein